MKSEQKGLVNTIKRNAFEVVDTYLNKYKPKNFGTSVQCIKQLQDFLALHFSEADNPANAANLLEASRDRYTKLWDVTSMYKQVLDTIMEDDFVFGELVALKEGPLVKQGLEDSIRTHNMVYTENMRPHVDVGDLLKLAPSDEEFGLLCPRKVSHGEYCVKFCKNREKNDNEKSKNVKKISNL